MIRNDEDRISCDSFKESMSAHHACLAAKRGFDRVFGNDYLPILILMSDGGEGMLDSIPPTLQGRIESMYTFELTGKPIEARYGWIEKSKTAIIESADTCGLTLIKKEDRNPLLKQHTNWG